MSMPLTMSAMLVAWKPRFAKRRFASESIAARFSASFSRAMRAV